MLLVQYEVTVSPSSLIVLAIKVYFQGPISLEGKLEIKQRSCGVELDGHTDKNNVFFKRSS